MHYRIFDSWRLMAAMLIMSYHFLFSGPPGSEGARDILFRLLPLLDMFFMISGFLITTRYGGAPLTASGYVVFLRRRVARLYPLHLLTLCFFAGLALLALATGAEHYPYAQELSVLPQHILAIHALGTTNALALNYASWSVSAEFFCYALFPAIVFSARRFGLSGILFLLAVWIAGLEVASALGAFPQGHWLKTDTFGAYRAFADFATGGALAVLAARRPLTIGSNLPAFFLLGLGVGAMAAGLGTYLSLAFVAGAILLAALSETARPTSTEWLAPLMPLARLSFGIYLWHPVMEAIFLTVVWDRFLGPSGLVSFYLFWLVPMAATIAAAFASERWFEKPVGNLIAHGGGKRETRRATA